MGADACVAACRLVRALCLADQARDDGLRPPSHKGGSLGTMIDPFCGQGSVLCVANELGLDSIGVDLNRRRCQQALAQRLLRVEDVPCA